MNDNQLLLILRQKIAEANISQVVDAEVQRNVLKEELQYFVLNFIYHHKDFRKWIMYGGSALRICHKLDRMSVDLDFEIDSEVSHSLLMRVKQELESHFRENYAVDSELLSVKIVNRRGLILRFQIGDKLDIRHSSKQVHVKIDLNHFTVSNVMISRQPVNRDQFSFVIKTYNMSALMASKIVAIFSRGERGVGVEIYNEKGRDIYDLLWYMNKGIIPDLDYMNAKKINIKDLGQLFNQLTLQMNKVNDRNLKNDLSPLFTNQTFIKHWLENWRETYFHILKTYNINRIVNFLGLNIFFDIERKVYTFIYDYQTEEQKLASLTFYLSHFWIIFRDGNLATDVDKELVKQTKINTNGSGIKKSSHDKILQFASLFYRKNLAYLKKTGNVVLGENISTKLIRMDSNKLSILEEICLDRQTLLNCELEDILK